MPGIIKLRTHQNIHADIGADILMAVVFFYRVNFSEKNSAFCHDIPAGLSLKEYIPAACLLPFSKKCIQFLLKGLNIEFLLICKLMVRSAEAAAEIQEFQLIKLLRIVQEVAAGLKERLVIHKERAYMLIQADDMEIILRRHITDLLDILGSYTELRLFSGGDDLIMVTGTYTWINSYRKLSATVQAAEHLELGKAVYTNDNALIDGILHLVFGDIIRYIEYSFARESGFFQRIDLSRAHRIRIQALFIRDFQNGKIGIRFNREIRCKAMIRQKAGNSPHLSSQDVFVIYKKRRPILGNQFFRISITKKVHLLRIGVHIDTSFQSILQPLYHFLA